MADLSDFELINISGMPSGTAAGANFLAQDDGSNVTKITINQAVAASQAMQQVNNKIGSSALPTTAQTLTGAIAEHEADLTALNGNLALKSGNISVTSGWTVQNSNNWCRKSGHVAEFYLEVTGGTLASGWNDLGTLPSEFRPLFTVNIVGVDNGSSGVPACQVQLQSNGTISVYKHSALTNNLRIFGVYLVA